MGEEELKNQWSILLGLLFAIIIAIFAVVNVNAVAVNYVFGQSEWPLVLIILCSALLGALVSGFFAMFRSIQQNRRLKELRKQLDEKEMTIATLTNEKTQLDNQQISKDLTTEAATAIENEQQ